VSTTCTSHHISWDDKIKEDEINRACSTHEKGRNSYKIMVGNPEGKKLLGRPTYKWDNKIDVRRIWCWDVNWDHVTRIRSDGGLLHARK
jgi:hypothetical protein